MTTSTTIIVIISSMIEEVELVEVQWGNTL